MSTLLAPVRSAAKPSYHCPACGSKRLLERQHPAGYCEVCMSRSRRYWLDRFSLAEIGELAVLIWPEDSEQEEVAA